MKRVLLISVAVLFACTFATAQGGGNQNGALEKVLNEMDAAAAHFRTAQANFTWDQYTKVVDDHDHQNGTVYFRRSPKEVQMAADVKEHNGKPEKTYILYTDSSVQVFSPGIDQIKKFNMGKNKSEAESFLVLGFGGRGHEMAKSFDVKYAGTERVDNVDTVKLELTPKAASIRNNFNRIVLWIDPARGVSVQQQFFTPSGDYRLTKYTNIKLNEKLSDDIFKIKKGPNTKVVTP